MTKYESVATTPTPVGTLYVPEISIASWYLYSMKNKARGHCGDKLPVSIIETFCRVVSANLNLTMRMAFKPMHTMELNVKGRR